MATHVVPRSTYYKTFAALLVLLSLTLIASRMDRGIINLVAALGIAFTKAALIGLFFMHVRYSSPLVRLVALAGLLWLSILMALTAGDYLTRDSGAPADKVPVPPISDSTHAASTVGLRPLCTVEMSRPVVRSRALM